MEFAIRKAKLTDIKELLSLFEGYRVFYRQEPAPEKAQVFLNARLMHNDSRIFVAAGLDGGLYGFTQLYPLFSSTQMKPLWLLNDLFVRPEQRGLGISKALISEAQELVRSTQACGLLLETEASNFVGNKLYPKMGFSRNEETNYYHWEPEA
jgi:GNAT superfamily N-acetyltransferase